MFVMLISLVWSNLIDFIILFVWVSRTQWCEWLGNGLVASVALSAYLADHQATFLGGFLDDASRGLANAVSPALHARCEIG